MISIDFITSIMSLIPLRCIFSLIGETNMAKEGPGGMEYSGEKSSWLALDLVLQYLNSVHTIKQFANFELQTHTHCTTHTDTHTHTFHETFQFKEPINLSRVHN